jgi:hypothetical protein
MLLAAPSVVVLRLIEIAQLAERDPNRLRDDALLPAVSRQERCFRCPSGNSFVLDGANEREFRGKLRAHAGHRGSRAWPIA